MLSSDLQALWACFDLPTDMNNLRRVFTLLMRCHFSDADNYGSLYKKDIGCYVFADDPQQSTLSVETAFVYDPNLVGNRPGVYVGFGPVVFTKRVQDNYQGESDDGGTTRYTSGANTQLQLHFVAPAADAALLLAESALSFLIGVRKDLMANLNFQGMDPGQLGQPTEYAKPPEKYYSVDLSFQIAFNLVVSANIESHRLKKVAMQLQPSV